MIQNLLGRKKKATRQERILSEIDRLISWKKLAACAETCLDEAPDCIRVNRNSLESLVRIEVLHRCFGISRSDLMVTGSETPEQDGATALCDSRPVLNEDDVENFYKIIADCSKQDEIINELGAQLARVGVSLKQPVSLSPS